MNGKTLQQIEETVIKKSTIDDRKKIMKTYKLFQQQKLEDTDIEVFIQP